MFSKNMSGFDRTFRLLLGLFLIAFAIAGKVGAWAWVVGLIVLATALLSRCPLYALLGFKPKRSDVS